MGQLKNARHERFAQNITARMSQADAYQDAGYKRHTGNASALAQNQSILERVAEIIGNREYVERAATEKAAAALAVDKEWVLRRLVENVDRAMTVAPVLDVEGKETGEFKYDGNVANRALELVGKHLGMFIDRSEVVNKVYGVSPEPLTDEQWVEQFGAESKTAH
jgi:phage terminase small subunit